MTISTTSTLMGRAICYPKTRFLYSIPSSSPKNLRRRHDGFNDQYGHDSHDGYDSYDNHSGWVELFHAKEFATAALVDYDKAFVAWFWRPKTSRHDPRRVFGPHQCLFSHLHGGTTWVHWHQESSIDLVDDLWSHPLALQTLFIHKIDGSLQLYVDCWRLS